MDTKRKIEKTGTVDWQDHWQKLDKEFVKRYARSIHQKSRRNIVAFAMCLPAIIGLMLVMAGYNMQAVMGVLLIAMLVAIIFFMYAVLTELNRSKTK